MEIECATQKPIVLAAIIAAFFQRIAPVAQMDQSSGFLNFFKGFF
jgi:hypothetical protein